MLTNPLFAIDFYKVDHRRQYPEGTTEIYSNFTPRFVKPCHSLLTDFDNKVVVFGIQKFIKEFLIEHFDAGFFNRKRTQVIHEYKILIEEALGIKDFDCWHLHKLHELGYLPIEIKALEEGTRVPIGVPILSVVNTQPDFFWLTNYLETIISASLWKPITCATIAFEFKRLLTRYANETGSDLSFVPYQAHDFSYRGMSGGEDARLCSAAHLTSFKGTDCVSAIELLNLYYSGRELGDIVGSSVPATEHSVMSAGGKIDEFNTIKRLITEIYPDGIVSIVCDTYDFWQVLTSYLPSLHNEINAREGKLIVRPDSGNPLDIICGDEIELEGSPARKGALQLLWETFGGRVNKEGYKELNPKIGLIYGDAITVERASLILETMKVQGFASSNIVFGVGSFTYQYITRDTFGFAMKATSAVINGERKAIFKEPKTQAGGTDKRSAKGLLKVDMDMETATYILHENVSKEIEQTGCLETVFKDGKWLNEVTLKTIRENLSLELELALS